MSGGAAKLPAVRPFDLQVNGYAGADFSDPGGLNGTGLGGPKAPRLCRGRFAAPGPVPLVEEPA